MKKLLVVVDYQNDFVNGSLGFDGADKLDAGIAAMIHKYHQAGDLIAVTLDTHDKNYLNTREGKNLPVEHCLAGTEGHHLYGRTREAIMKLQNEDAPAIVFQKETFGVSPQDLLSKLSNHEFDEIVFVGLVTNMCVLSNVCCFQALFPEAQMVVYENLCDSFDRELHEKTLDVLRGMQVKIKKG